MLMGELGKLERIMIIHEQMRGKAWRSPMPASLRSSLTLQLQERILKSTKGAPSAFELCQPS